MPRGSEGERRPADVIGAAVTKKESSMSGPKSYNGSCFCGAVQFTVTGEPASMGYCHCTSCRHWSASPVNAFTLWSPESVNYAGRGKYRHV
jgi:hypothetical protein